MIGINKSLVGISSDLNTLNVLGELLLVGSSVSKNSPLAKSLNYYGAATKGIHKGLKKFGIQDSKKNLEAIKLTCILCGSAEKRDLNRLRLSLKISY